MMGCVVRGSWCFAQLLLVFYCRSGWAAPAADLTNAFADPIELEAVRLWVIPAANAEPLQEFALAIDLAVAHRDRQLGLLVDSRTYHISEGLAERLDHDLGPYTAAALRKIQGALLQSGADEAYRNLIQAHMRPVERHLHYRVLPAALLPLDVEQHISALADRFYRDTLVPLVFTSGTRTPESQARAMLGILRHGASFKRLYRKQAAAREIKQAYLRAKSRGTRQIVKEMATVIRQQMARGVYISPHLRAGAVDIRSRNMTPSLKRRLRQAVTGFPNIKLNREERRPPHFHMEVYTRRWTPSCAHRRTSRGKRYRSRRVARSRSPRLRATRSAP